LAIGNWQLAIGSWRFTKPRKSKGLSKGQFSVFLFLFLSLLSFIVFLGVSQQGGFKNTKSDASNTISKCIFFGGCGKIPATFLIAFLNSPCHETPKNAIKKSMKTKKVSSSFVFGVAANARHFRHFFSRPPLLLRLPVLASGLMLGAWCALRSQPLGASSAF
jgi:hypothetical protein